MVERKGLMLAPKAKVSVVTISSQVHSFIHLFIHQTLSNTPGPSARLLGLPVLMGTVSLVVLLLSSHTLVAVSWCHFPIPAWDQAGEVSPCPTIIKVQRFRRVQKSILMARKVLVGWRGWKVWPYSTLAADGWAFGLKPCISGDLSSSWLHQWGHRWQWSLFTGVLMRDQELPPCSTWHPENTPS